jgi:hypothetical protein
MIGRVGAMETSESNVNITPKDYNKSIVALRDKIWKLLPIYEGRDRDRYISIPQAQAYKNYCKNLNRLIIQVQGAEKIWFENTFFTELVCLLTGLEGKFYPIEPQTIRDIERINKQHEELKSTITHCTDLCQKMKVAEGE